MTPRALAVLSSFTLALGAAGCGSSSSGGDGGSPQTSSAGGGVKVAMKDVQFKPGNVTVAVGQKITWDNQDGIPHNVTATSGADFKSGTVGPGGTYSFTPAKAGTIAYECTIHPGQQGTITVTG